MLHHRISPDDSDGEVDENEPDKGQGLVNEGENVQPKLDFTPVPGYNNVRLDNALLPPPPTDKPKPASHKEPEFLSAPVITEETARTSLLEYIAEKCCWGKRAAEAFIFKNLQSSTSYHYILETFTEERSTKWDHDPYHGQFVDGPQHGPAPGPWDIAATFRELFKDEEQLHEVPHTANVKSCHKCNGCGQVRCTRCQGRGRVRCGRCGGDGRVRRRRKDRWVTTSCGSCGGRGRKRCVRCGGDGRVTCGTCKGHGKLRWFILLTINWKNNVADHIVEKTALPDELIAHAAGTLGFQDQQINLLPISRFPEGEINDASHRLLGQHKFPSRRIHMQRQVIRIVPVTECYCQYKDNELSYFVYGLDSKVYAPEYPHQCCWGCVIL